MSQSATERKRKRKLIRNKIPPILGVWDLKGMGSINNPCLSHLRFLNIFIQEAVDPTSDMIGGQVCTEEQTCYRISGGQITEDPCMLPLRRIYFEVNICNTSTEFPNYAFAGQIDGKHMSGMVDNLQLLGATEEGSWTAQAQSGGPGDDTDCPKLPAPPLSEAVHAS